MSAAVFQGLVGQNQAVAALEKALEAAVSGSSGQEMTHAWLFTGPPGSGRSNIAKAFAAALICRNGGCGECVDCETASTGTHPDVELVDVSGLSIKIDDIREIVSRSAWGASTSKWRVVVIEDSDRMTEAAANALLKALEEPGASTIWLLCAPSLHDVLPTIRSRCRHINLKTPNVNEIAKYLVEQLNADEAEAKLAAQISQGHIGKARGYLRDQEFRSVRRKSFEILFSVQNEAGAIRAAGDLLRLATERVEAKFAAKIEIEMEELKSALQGGGRGLISGGAKSIKDLEKDQKSRTTRAIKDELDGYLLDYLTLFRDCLTPSGQLVNQDLATEISKIGQTSPAGVITHLIARTNETRELLTTNASQALLLESLFLEFPRINRGN